MRYTVYSLDVWGHVPSECCAAWGCTCVSQDDELNETHDDDHCDCGCEVNDRCRVGTIDVATDCTDDDLLTALKEAGLVNHLVPASDVEFDDSCWPDVYLNDDKGTPVFHLESADEY